ncbi:hypothetical protein TNCV_1752511 [Trichonephila clavipes]|nr:hypothetical protein TNCV_1752511 [Trichonephila clavipes]
MCLEIVCGTIAKSTSARIVERVTVGFTNACRTILRSFSSWSSWSLQTRYFHAWVTSVSTAPKQYLTAHPNDPPGEQHGASTSLQFTSR